MKPFETKGKTINVFVLHSRTMRSIDSRAIRLSIQVVIKEVRYSVAGVAGLV